jgi:dTDP-4-dehydrorhamnose reductase
MAIVVTGANGQLGRGICRMLGPRAIPFDIDTLDLTNGPVVVGRLLDLRPEAVVNCAAYTQVDRAESEPEACREVNARAVRHLARACRRLDCPLVQISTDYVFGGREGIGRPWREDDEPAPSGIYAATKYEGERTAATTPKHLIVRTCGLYARPSHAEAKNFVRSMLRLAEERRELDVVDDQHCTPTYVPHLAKAVLFLLGSDGGPAAPWGIYHVTNSGAATWHEFACEIFRLAGVAMNVRRITTAEYGAPAPRPAYSVLDVGKYHALGGPPMPDWKAALAEYFEQRKQPQV